MTLKQDLSAFQVEQNTALDAFNDSVENAVVQFDTQQDKFFKEDLRVKDTNSFFVEFILGSIFVGLGGIAVGAIASKLFTPLIKTRALIVQKGNTLIVSSITQKELQTLKSVTLPSGMNFLADDASESFAKRLFTGTFDQAIEKFEDRIFKGNDQSSGGQQRFSSRTDDFKTVFKEKVDWWTGQFKKQQTLAINKIIQTLEKSAPSAELEKELRKEFNDLRNQISDVDSIDEMKQIRYYFELCLWSILYQYILFHGAEEVNRQTINPIAARQARTGNYQYPGHFADVPKFNLPKKIPKNVYDYWTHQFPHPLSPLQSFADYYRSKGSNLADRYNVSILKGSYKKTTEEKYLKPLLEADMYNELSNYMQKVAKQFEGASKFTDIVTGGPK